MKYFVAVGARTYAVDLAGDRVTVDGAVIEAHLSAVPGTPLHHLLLDAQSWTVAAEPLDAAERSASSRWVLIIAGERREVAVTDERTRQIEELTGRKAAKPSSGVIRAPMPGLVVRLEVGLGDRVEALAPVVVVEAMKMENELRAPAQGVVSAVHVAPGQPVEKGAPLVTLELTAP